MSPLIFNGKPKAFKGQGARGVSRVCSGGTEGRYSREAFGLFRCSYNDTVSTLFKKAPHSNTYMSIYTPSNTFLPPFFLKLSINFPFCLVAADIPNTAISAVASDPAPWKPSAQIPSSLSYAADRHVELKVWKCYCI